MASWKTAGMSENRSGHEATDTGIWTEGHILFVSASLVLAPFSEVFSLEQEV